MEAWQSMNDATAPKKSLDNPWTAALENWWKSASTGASPQTKDLFSLLTEQGKVFFDLSSQINHSITDALQPDAHATDMEKIINKSFDGLRESLTIGATKAPMDAWLKIAGDSAKSTGDIVLNQVHSTGHQFLAAPGVGIFREKQEQLQNLAKLVAVYQKAYGEYLNAQIEIGNLAVNRLQERVSEMFTNNEQPESFRNLYDMWVDCYEEVYADYVMKPAYVVVYGDLVNSLMNVTRAQREMQDDLLEAVGMPSRREIDTILRRFQEERREKHGMRSEIAELKAQISQLSAAKAAPARRSTSRRKPKATSKSSD